MLDIECMNGSLQVAKPTGIIRPQPDLLLWKRSGKQKLFENFHGIEAAFGKNKFLAIFFISLITGSLASAYFAQIPSASVGASGAIFGLFGALAIVGKRIGTDTRSVYIIIGINFAIGFALGGVDWHAHLGGLLGGVCASQILLTKR